MAEIQLLHGHVCLIDDADLPLVAGRKWLARPRSNDSETIYVWSTEKPHVRIHRLLMDAPKGVEVDHINGNGLDNRRCNLRLADRWLQTVNRRMFKNNTTGYRGVQRQGKNLYTARLGHHGKDFCLGTFRTAIDAAKAFDAAARQLRGEFARTNLPYDPNWVSNPHKRTKKVPQPPKLPHSHCAAGHLYAPGTFYVRGKQGRYCRICQRQRYIKGKIIRSVAA